MAEFWSVLICHVKEKSAKTDERRRLWLTEAQHQQYGTDIDTDGGVCICNSDVFLFNFYNMDVCSHRRAGLY